MLFRFEGRVAALCAAVLTLAGHAGAEELRVGFVTDHSGPGALQTVHQRNGWLLGLEHEGWARDGDNVRGVPLRMFFSDDQGKPDIGLREVNKLLLSEKVHIVAGFLSTNILLPAVKPVVDAKRILLGTLSGPSHLAGSQCTPYFISTANSNEQGPLALGPLVAADGIKSVYLLAPNYQGGRDVLAGFQRTYKGTIAGQTLFKLGEADFQAEISKLRSTNPEAVFIFAPGAMGIAFMKQWEASGAGASIKVYTTYTIDHLTLPAIGTAAIGTFHMFFWDPDSADPNNRRFIRDYAAKYGHTPSDYAVMAYDGARLVAAGLEAVGGKFDDLLVLAKAMRQAKIPSPRGTFTYNVNGFPIQNYYKREVVRGADGKAVIVTRGLAVRDSKDPFYEECPAERRL